MSAEQQAGMDTHMRTLENAVGIVQLRLSSNGHSQRTGEALMPETTTTRLLAFIAQTALTVRGIVMELEA
jgi:hypothetical protein